MDQNVLKNVETQKRESISVIIPTCNRQRSLKRLLESIILQSILPNEVIIVDDGDRPAENFVEKLRKLLLEKNVSLKYLRNLDKNSLSAVRNLGAKQAKENMLFFFDDDITLHPRYIEEILKVYKKYPSALGVQGLITNIPMGSRLLLVLNKAFFGNHLEKNQCNVLPSWCTTYPYPQLNKVINCQWFSGCNQTYLRTVFESQNFDKKLMGFSCGEDIDFSYRIFKKYPTSLYITPHAKISHDYSLGSASNEVLIYHRSINAQYFFYKNITQTPFNKLIFCWHFIGELLINMVFHTKAILTIGKPKELKRKSVSEIKHLIKAYIYTIKHYKELKSGNLEFFDFLKHSVTKS